MQFTRQQFKEEIQFWLFVIMMPILIIFSLGYYSCNVYQEPKPDPKVAAFCRSVSRVAWGQTGIKLETDTLSYMYELSGGTPILQKLDSFPGGYTKYGLNTGDYSYSYIVVDSNMVIVKNLRMHHPK